MGKANASPGEQAYSSSTERACEASGIEHPGRVQRGPLSRLAKQAACLRQIGVRSRESLKFSRQTRRAGYARPRHCARTNNVEDRCAR